MRIGVVSDTHNNLRSVRRIVELFDAAGVEHVVHTGDITQGRTLRALAAMQAPIVGVYGNNDEREGLAEVAMEFAVHLVEPPLEVAWAGRRVVVVHDPKAHPALRHDAPDVLLHGHEHRHVAERRDGRLTFNPGECAGHMEGLNAVGVLDLVTLEVELLRF